MAAVGMIKGGAAPVSGRQVVDFSYLRQQSLGNAALETEILELFLRQSVLIMLEIRENVGKTEWRSYLRTLKSSALNIGAMDVANQATTLELVETVEEAQQGLQSLEGSVLAANGFIRSHLQGNS